MATGAVVVRILSQYSDKGNKQAQKDIKSLGKKIDAFGKTATKSFGLAAAAGVAAAYKIGKESVMAASDLSQQFGALDAVFGNSAQQLKDFSKTMAEFGLSAADSARFSALLGTQLQGLGLEEQDAIDRTKKLQLLAADLAATFGGTVADAVSALSSTFKGEYNPIEKYGVAIRKSDITARLAQKGLKGLTGETLKAAEAQAGYEIIMEKTSSAQGQAMREYNTLAGLLGRVQASFKNVEASLGEALLPVVESFTGYLLSDVIPQLQAWVDINKYELSGSLRTVGENIKDAAKAIGSIYKVIDAVNKILPFGIGGYIQIAAAIKALQIVYGVVSIALGIYTATQVVNTAATQSGTVGARAALVQMMATSTGYAANAAALQLINTKLWASSPLYARFINFLKLMKLALAQLLPKPILLILAALTAVAFIAKKIIGYFKDQKVVLSEASNAQDKAMTKLASSYETMDQARNKAIKSQEHLNGLTADEIKDKKIQAALDAKNAAAAARTAAAELARDKILLKIKKATAFVPTKGSKAKAKDGLVPIVSLEPAMQDAIQYEAMRKLLEKQKEADESLKKRLELRVKELGLFNELAKSAKKYQDIVDALSDGTISANDLILLGKKWNVPTDAAKMYVQQILGLGQLDLQADKVAMMGATWGMTGKQASAYLAFTDLIQKGNYSDADIVALGAAHGMGADQAKKYHFYVNLIKDLHLSDADVLAIKKAYGDTNDEIVEMLANIGAPVKYEGNILDAKSIKTLEDRWIAAKKAMDDYWAARNGFKDGAIIAPILPPAVTGCPTGSTMINGKCTPISTGPKGDDKIVVTPDYSGDDGIARRAAANARAAAEAAAKAAENSTGTQGDALARFKAKEAADLAKDNAKRAAEVAAQGDALARFRSKEAADNAKDIAAAEAQAASAVAAQANALSGFRAKEAADEAAYNAARSASTGKFNTPTMDNSKGLMGGNGGGDTNVYVTVNGTVTGEQDLVATIRRGLLAGQYNGQSLTLEAI